LLPKSPHSYHNTVNKNSIEQNIEQCQHPGKGAHIHFVEQARPQGLKKNSEKTTKYITTTKYGRKTLPCNNPEHNYPYQIGKIEVPQHQPQYDNGIHR